MTKDEIIELIDELTERLDGPAEQLFQLAAKAVVTQGIILTVASATALIASIVLLVWCRRRFVEAKANSSGYSSMDGEGYLTATVPLAILAICGFIFFFVGLNQLINYEFYAIVRLVPGI